MIADATVDVDPNSTSKKSSWPSVPEFALDSSGKVGKLEPKLSRKLCVTCTDPCTGWISQPLTYLRRTRIRRSLLSHAQNHARRRSCAKTPVSFSCLVHHCCCGGTLPKRGDTQAAGCGRSYLGGVLLSLASRRVHNANRKSTDMHSAVPMPRRPSMAIGTATGSHRSPGASPASRWRDSRSTLTTRKTGKENKQPTTPLSMLGSVLPRPVLGVCMKSDPLVYCRTRPSVFSKTTPMMWSPLTSSMQ